MKDKEREKFITELFRLLHEYRKANDAKGIQGGEGKVLELIQSYAKSEREAGRREGAVMVIEFEDLQRSGENEERYIEIKGKLRKMGLWED